MSVQAPARSKGGESKTPDPRVLRNGEEIRQFFAKHLTPIKKSPSGAPVYRAEDIEELLLRENVRLPE